MLNKEQSVQVSDTREAQ